MKHTMHQKPLGLLSPRLSHVLMLTVMLLVMVALHRDMRSLMVITEAGISDHIASFPQALIVIKADTIPHLSSPEMKSSIAYNQSKSQRLPVLILAPELILKSSNRSIRVHGGENKSGTTPQRGESLISTTADAAFAGPSLWVHIEEFSEGMSSWRLALAEVVAMTKKLNATLVEPCIYSGRLKACKEGGSRFRLGQLYDLDKLREFQRYIVPFEDYQQRMTALQKPKVFDTCFARPGTTPSPIVVCGSTSRGLIPNAFGLKRIHIIEDASKHDGPAVLRLNYYRKGGLHKAKWMDGQNLVPEMRVRRILKTNFDFRQEHYQKVDHILEELGIANGTAFDVIHWRAELPHLNYDQCVNRILNAKEALSPKNETPLILMSSLSLRSGFQWGNTLFRQKAANQGLVRLMSAGLRKLDQIKDLKVSDIVDLAAWDQIMALKARRFTTCSRSCGQSHFCSACNYRGNFAQFAIDLRTKHGKESDTCWVG